MFEIGVTTTVSWLCHMKKVQQFKINKSQTYLLSNSSLLLIIFVIGIICLTLLSHNVAFDVIYRKYNIHWDISLEQYYA